MKVESRTLASLNRCYSICVVPGSGVGVLPEFLAASEGSGPILAFNPPDFAPQMVSDGPGGFISMAVFMREGHRWLAASAEFLPGFDAAGCRILCYPLDRGPRIAACEVARLPYTHRVATFAQDGRQFFLASTLCSGKRDKDDWSQPGGIHLAEIPAAVGEPWRLRQIVRGLHKNHGMDIARMPYAHRGGYLLSAADGLFYMPIPDSTEGSWSMTQIAVGEHSDAWAWTEPGGDYAEVFAIKPFHGNCLVRYEKMENEWREHLIADDIEMGHVLWAGNLLGEFGLLVGGRKGDAALRLYRRSKQHQFTCQLRLDGVSPSQIAVVNVSSEAAVLYVAAHGLNEVRLYRLTRGG